MLTSGSRRPYNFDPMSCLTDMMHLLQNRVCTGVLRSLAREPMDVGTICTVMCREQSVVSHALAGLRACELVDVEQDKKRRVYKLSNSTNFKLEGQMAHLTLQLRNGEVLDFRMRLAEDAFIVDRVGGAIDSEMERGGQMLPPRAIGA